MAESTPSPQKRGEVDTSKPYTDVKEAIHRFDHLPGVKNSAERAYESPIGALKEQLVEAMAAKDKMELDKREVEQELAKLKESYEQLSKKLEMALSIPESMGSEEREDLQKLYERTTQDLEASRERIQDLEDHKVGESSKTIESLSMELEAARDREKSSMAKAGDLSTEVERLTSQVGELAEELRIAKEELDRLRSSESRAMAEVGDAAAEISRVEAAIKAVEDEKITLQATTRYLETELESTKLEHESLQRDRGEGEEENPAVAIEKIKAKIEAVSSLESKAMASAAGMLEGYELVSAEAIEAEVVRAGVSEEVARMRNEAWELKLATMASEKRVEDLTQEALAAKESEARAMKSIRQDDDRAESKESMLEEETAGRLREASAEEASARAREEELKRSLETARAEIEETRVDLKQANEKAAIAEAAKSAVEGELRRWRSENEQRRRMAMVANLTAATPVPQRNGDASPATILASSVSIAHPEAKNDGNGRRFSSSSREIARSATIEEGRRSSGESLAQVLQIKLPDASGVRSKNLEQIVVESAEIKKKKLRLLARLGAIFTARKKHT
ncbi:WEB family protein At5g55860 isoform X2 [Selaginella moellendorffii]|uniref:WEB family protein At5g55860 isoform X2 n=1 Tax=Selaginella moellendorffii TaxID=88036 RepID=UPI000D1CBF38|nr:WEB family protein At5g55860 isoform X2 [Selaginella moellendorffii]|eukprot:XP_024518998.1 WEB family protein At5g55860 isoform X2 [Selaginella moellendorffii]